MAVAAGTAAASEPGAVRLLPGTVRLLQAVPAGQPADAAPGVEEGGVDVRDYGAVGDGRTDDTRAFRRALEAIGGDEGTIRIVRGSYRVEGISFPGTVTLAFRDGGTLHVPAGGRIEVNAAVDAGMREIFAGAGSVQGRIQARYVYPQWFGARGDGVHDDAPALQRAADLATSSMGRTLFIPEGEYRFESDVVFRSDVESRGLLVKEMEIDEARTEFSYDLYLPVHSPKSDPHVVFAPDHEEVELDASSFYGIDEGQYTVPVYRDVPLADGSGRVDLAEGGTLRFYSSDFFTSRRVRKGAHYYDRNDIVQLVSGRGDVFPEFAFDYAEPRPAEEWSAGKRYAKGDYVTFGGRLFRATTASGEGSGYVHPHLGEAVFGPVQPRPDQATTVHAYEYPDGTEDEITMWRRVATRVWYREKDVPVTVNGFRVEVRLAGHEGRVKRIRAGAVIMRRSNITLNDLKVSVRDPEATMYRLFVSAGAVNVEVNNGYFSGATAAHTGYNILNSNVANVRYNNTVSMNSRKGMDGRHAKNVTVQGGYYNVIEDHYGRNFVIRGVVANGLSVAVPGDGTPAADLQAWEFRPRQPFGLAGANMLVENSTVDRAVGGIFRVRSDVGDLYGNIVLKNIAVRRNGADVLLFNHTIDPDFDYAHDVRVPDHVIIEDITLENPGRLHLNIGEGFRGGAYGPVEVRNTGPLGNVFSTSPSTTFLNSTFEDARFTIPDGAYVNFRNSVFSGDNADLNPDRIGVATGNVTTPGATVPFPLDHLNATLYVKP